MEWIQTIPDTAVCVLSGRHGGLSADDALCSHLWTHHAPGASRPTSTVITSTSDIRENGSHVVFLKLSVINSSRSSNTFGQAGNFPLLYSQPDLRWTLDQTTTFRDMSLHTKKKKKKRQTHAHTPPSLSSAILSLYTHRGIVKLKQRATSNKTNSNQNKSKSNNDYKSSSQDVSRASSRPGRPLGHDLHGVKVAAFPEV